jgi:hypothetical protein
MLEKDFKQCTCCNHEWKTRESFLADPGVELVGYQVSFGELVLGLLLFNHTCGTTIAISVNKLRDLYAGSVYATRKTGTKECPGYCLKQDNLRPCPAQCECAWVRDLIQLISKMKKTGSK